MSLIDSIPFAGPLSDRDKVDYVINRLYPDLKAGRQTGIRMDGVIRFDVSFERGGADSLLMALSSLHRVYLNDSLIEDPSWRFYYHPERRQRGLLYTMPAHELPVGEHRINVQRHWYRESGDSLYWAGASQINFYR